MEEVQGSSPCSSTIDICLTFFGFSADCIALLFTDANAIKYSMKEAFVEAMTAGAFLLSPHPIEQSGLAEPAPSIEIVVDHESLAAAQPASAENFEPAVSPPRAEGHDVAILESLDPETVVLWLEFGGGGLGVTGVSGFVTSRQLKRSLRHEHAAIKDEGREAHIELSEVLDTAKWQVSDLREDDVLKLRELIKNHSITADTLLSGLAGTDAEFKVELDRFFPLKRRLHEAPDTKRLVQTTETAKTQIQTLQQELDRVQTNLAGIEANLDHAESTVASLRADLNALIQKGWDVGAYEQRTAAFEEAVATARAKRAENYIDGPTEIAKSTADEALELKGEVGILESRRTAAAEVYGTQSGRITKADATVEAVRERFTKLQDIYSEACLDGFEDLQDELTEALTILTAAYEAGGELTGKQGLSVESVKRSEELSEFFDEALEDIQLMQEELREREEDLAALAAQLPREISKLTARFNRAMELADSPDVEGDTSDEIRSLAEDVAKLSVSISTDEGHKPDYLDIEEDYLDLAEQVNQAHTAAIEQKQEMDDLRTDIPELIDGYNGLVATIKDFANHPKVKLKEETQSYIKRLQDYTHERASDRKNLRKQKRRLEGLLREARELMGRAREEADEDGLLLKGAKIVGGTALAIITLDILDD